jgi:ribonucleoside-diphosphate reductase alpha chain
MILDDKIVRYFTKNLENSDKTVFDLFSWKKVSVKLVNHATNETILEMNELDFPEHYSQAACDIIASKYFRKKGIPGDRDEEYSMRQLVDRMVSFWVASLKDEKILSKEQGQIVYDELAYMLLAQMWAPNSPQWFNTGLFHAYGITDQGQGHFYYDPKKKEVVQSKDSYTRTQGSACFIVGVVDSLIGKNSLTDKLTSETLLFKYGSGVGSNWSPIRGKDEGLSVGGKSSGLLSFLKVSDRNAGAIKSGGTTRRAAKMNILNLDHPEILDYINWKSIEEDKVLALGKMGYSTALEGEAYETVSGQNSNNSIRIPNSFMNKLAENPESDWLTKGRVDDTVNKTMKVSDIWNATASAAWRCGDPGVQYDDIINAWHTCPSGEDGKYGEGYNRINASNPCSEYMFLDDTACNLASINIYKFYNQETGSFDIEGYLHAILFIQLALEATIHWGQFPTEEIARKSHMFRTTGLGLTNIGLLFMVMGLAYDSEEARQIGASLSSLMTGYSYYTSALMAEKIEPFEMYQINSKHMNKVIRNHARVASYDAKDNTLEDMPYKPLKIDHKVLTSLGYTELSKALSKVWKSTIKAGESHGYRNAQVSVLAPTGTIAFAMDCATTSSEPFFSHVVFKKLVGGSHMTIVNPAIATALERLGYAPEEVDAIVEYVMATDENGFIKDGKIEGAPYLKEEHLAVFDTANRCGSGERYISPQAHVKMMAALTPHITGAISKTVNLPNEATEDDIKDIYQLSWELGVKAIALYRDGCKVIQVLSTNHGKEEERSINDYTYQELIDHINDKDKVIKPTRVKPTGIRSAQVHKAAINGLTLYITASYYADGRLVEIFASSGKQGSLVKGLLESLSITISKMLQYGIPPQDIASMYRGQKYEPNGFVTEHPHIKHVDSISDLISKIIDIETGDYTYCQVKPDEEADGEVTQRTIFVKGRDDFNAADFLYGEVCAICKSDKMVKNGTCKVCIECGTTTGCS